MKHLQVGEVEVWAPVVWEQEWTDALSGAPMKAAEYRGCDYCGNQQATLMVVNPVRNPQPEGRAYWTHVCALPAEALMQGHTEPVTFERAAFLADTTVPLSLFRSDRVDFLFRMRHAGLSLTLPTGGALGLRPDNAPGAGEPAGSRNPRGGHSRSSDGAQAGAAAPVEARPVLE